VKSPLSTRHRLPRQSPQRVERPCLCCRARDCSSALAPIRRSRRGSTARSRSFSPTGCATTRRLGYGTAGDLDSEAVLEDELDIGVLDHVSQAGNRFSRLLQTLAAG
jgi:hypothetical protein